MKYQVVYSVAMRLQMFKKYPLNAHALNKRKKSVRCHRYFFFSFLIKTIN